MKWIGDWCGRAHGRLALAGWVLLLLLLSFCTAWAPSTISAAEPSAPLDLIALRILSISECEKRIRHDGSNWRAAATGAAVYWQLPQSDLIARLIDRRENKSWDTTALSEAGAVGLTQIKPITVCRYSPGCRPSDKLRLDSIAQRLREKPQAALCWAGKILSRLLATCESAGVGCAVSAYYTGEVGAIYAADVLRD